MRMDKLTSKFQMALADAQSLAVGRDHQFIEPIHLMAALLDQVHPMVDSGILWRLPEAPLRIAAGDRVDYLGTSIEAGRRRVEALRIQCVGEQIHAFVERRLGEVPADVDLDEALVRTLAPLDAWFRG